MGKLLATCVLLAALAIQASSDESKNDTCSILETFKDEVNVLISDIDEEIFNVPKGTLFYSIEIDTLEESTKNVTREVNELISQFKEDDLETGCCGETAIEQINLAQNLTLERDQECFKNQSVDATKAVEQLNCLRERAQELLCRLDDIEKECSSQQDCSQEDCIAEKLRIESQEKAKLEQSVNETKCEIEDSFTSKEIAAYECYGEAVGNFYKLVSQARSSVFPCIEELNQECLDDKINE